MALLSIKLEATPAARNVDVSHELAARSLNYYVLIRAALAQ